MRLSFLSLCTVVAFVLAATLMFGGLVHAFLPHSHSPHEVITSSLHAVLHHEGKQFLDLVSLAPLLGFFVLTFICVRTLRRRIYTLVLSVLSSNSLIASLHRGILPYRAFP